MRRFWLNPADNEPEISGTGSSTLTRNTHAHLCLAPVRRLCARFLCGCRWGARGTCYVCCRIGEASCLVFVVSKPWWLRCAVVPDLHLHRQSRLRSIWVEHIWVCQTVWRTYGLYLGARPCLCYVTTFRVTFLSVTHHVRTYVRTYVHTYFVRIDPGFRASR